MREIKFRGKRVDNGEWVESMTISKGVIKRKRDLFYMEMPEDNWTQVIPETAGQFTGLKDKNGTDIYEGDVYTTGNDSAYLVVFEGGAFCGNDGEGSKPLDWDYDYAEGDLCPDQFSQQIKVIGNIHDNPELLEA